QCALVPAKLDIEVIRMSATGRKRTSRTRSRQEPCAERTHFPSNLTALLTRGNFLRMLLASGSYRLGSRIHLKEIWLGVGDANRNCGGNTSSASIVADHAVFLCLGLRCKC